MADEEIKVGAPIPIDQIPSHKGMSKYDAIFAEVKKLEQGQWLPITAPNLRMGQRLVDIAKQRGYLKKRRGLVVYVARRDEDYVDKCS